MNLLEWHLLYSITEKKHFVLQLDILLVATTFTKELSIKRLHREVDLVGLVRECI